MRCGFPRLQKSRRGHRKTHHTTNMGTVRIKNKSDHAAIMARIRANLGHRERRASKLAEAENIEYHRTENERLYGPEYETFTK